MYVSIDHLEYKRVFPTILLFNTYYVVFLFAYFVNKLSKRVDLTDWHTLRITSENSLLQGDSIKFLSWVHIIGLYIVKYSEINCVIWSPLAKLLPLFQYPLQMDNSDSMSFSSNKHQNEKILIPLRSANYTWTYETNMQI